MVLDQEWARSKLNESLTGSSLLPPSPCAALASILALTRRLVASNRGRSHRYSWIAAYTFSGYEIQSSDV